MKLIVDTLLLRPVFTHNALRVLWYAYLIGAFGALFHLAWFANLSIQSAGSSGGGVSSVLFLIPPFLFELAKLGLVRLFLEIAAQFVSQRRAEQ